MFIKLFVSMKIICGFEFEVCVVKFKMDNICRFVSRSWFIV